MRRLCTLAFVGAICGATLGPATAVQGDVLSRVWHGYKQNREWPYPYVYPDREQVRGTMSIIVANGWRTQNTLGDQYFVDEGSELNDAGKLKLRYIARLTPTQRRTVFVLESDDPTVTAARIEAVQTAMAHYLAAGEEPMITTTRVPNLGSSAEYIDQVERKFRDTTPDPRIPKESSDDQAN
ncbi:MAG: hypothetical protein KF708_09475 [Pirellulales bacterium]|nr:hypothetical protein [Pirellulales bacterium]